MVNPDTAVVAYCAPGLKAYTSKLLDDWGEVYREVVERPSMVGRTDIVLETDPSWYTRQHDESSRP